MLILTIIVFAIAAILGVYLLTFVLQGKNTPKGIAFTHGPIAALGLVLLIIYAFLHTPAPGLIILIFALAALGGFYLVFRDITGKTLPKWMAIGHGSVAVIGFIYLLYFAYTQANL